MTTYHSGERAAQERAGLRAEADRVSALISSEIPAAAGDFLADQSMVVIGAADASGNARATMVTGLPGFITSPSSSTVEIAALPVRGDPLRDVLAARVRVGLIVIDPGSRRRIRMNGMAQPVPGGFRVDLSEVYPNCPKYIQRRVARWAPTVSGAPQVGIALTPDEIDFVTNVDTFFIATTDGQGNADASHRGGNPGFVRVVSPTHLRWPDYVGNSMFNTLGNLAVNPRAGLLLPDWRTGGLLQLSGTAAVDWDPGHAVQVPGARRLVDFTLHEVVRIDGASSLRWGDPEPSRFNPSAYTGATP